MMQSLLRFFANISAHFNFDILWRICQKLSPEDRRFLAWRLLHLEAEHVTFRRGNTLWTGDTRDTTIMMPLFALGGYQSDEINALLNWMKHHRRLSDAHPFILDIGANIGTTCIPMAQKTNSRILAIEPVTESFDLLKCNVQQNHLEERILCVQKAILRQPGTLEMAIPVGNNGGSYINREDRDSSSTALSGQQIRETTTVSADLLSNILNEYQITAEQVAFAWCDTEGCETDVIETGQALWSSGVPIYIEINPQALNVQGNLDTFVDFIGQYFDSFLSSTDLLQIGIDAKARPVSDLSKLIEALQKENDNITDVLLLPIGFGSLIDQHKSSFKS